MPSHEQVEDNTPAQPERPPIEIGITPSAEEGIVFQTDSDGRQTIALQGEIAISLASHLALPEQQLTAPGSRVTDTELLSSSLLPDGTPPPASEPHSDSDTASKEAPETKEDEGNRKHLFTGNVATEPYFPKTRKPVAHFVLAEHPSDEETVFHRIVAFGKQAEKVRDRVTKGQLIEVTAYGPKTWRVAGKKQGEREERVGYYAGFVKVPKAASGNPPAQK